MIMSTADVISLQAGAIMMGWKIKLNGDEEDVVSSWRHLYCYLARPGVASNIKRQIRRRDRHEAKDQIRKEDQQ